MPHPVPHPANPPARYVSVEAGAGSIGISAKTLRRRIAAGELEAYRFGPRIIRVREADVLALLQPVPTTTTTD